MRLRGTPETVDTHELSMMQPQIDDMFTAREARDTARQLAHSRETDTLMKKQHELDAERACVAETVATVALTSAIHAEESSTLSPAHKAIAIKVLSHVWRSPRDESMELVRTGSESYDRVAADMDHNKGVLAMVATDSVALFNANGANDIRVTWANPNSAYNGSGVIDLVLSDGYRAAIESSASASFPDTAVEKATKKYEIMPLGFGNNIAEQEFMSRFDPQSARYRLPFTRLGGANSIGQDINELLLTDEARYAARLVQSTLGDLHTVLDIKPPGEALQATVIDRFADIYQDLLVGDTPRDSATHYKLDRGMGGSYLETERLRQHSLAELSGDARRRMFYAAHVNPDEVEAATREKIAKLPESGSAYDTVRALRAAPLMSQFFETIYT
jgi:hypothetical protein